MAVRASNAFLRPYSVRAFILPYKQTWHSISQAQRRITTRMEPSRVRYKFVEEVERLDYYVPGGYHPVTIGDEFCSGRYIIAHKLGFGRSATTWLAEDRRQSRLVALKILTAESAERTHEIQVLSQLARAKSELSGRNTPQKVLDSFTFCGPNGTHLCLVTEAARISIHEAKDAAYHRLLHLPAARAIASQLILGLQFIHSQGIVHGDLHLANILLRLPSEMQDMTIKQLYARTGEPVKEQVVREDGAPLDIGVPSEVIVPAWLGLGSDEISLVDSAIMIADFGEAYNPRVTKQFIAHTPLLLAPPESRFAGSTEFDEPLSFSGDIWTLGCTIWDIFGSAPPFEAFPATLDGVTIEQVEMLGKLPDRWWSKWEERSNWFDEDGRKNVKEYLRQWYGNSTRNWIQRFTEYIHNPRERKRFDTFSAEEENAFCDMIKSMLVLEPSKRATIEDIVGCEWMRKWGLPEVQRMQDAKS
ncbi:putative non-specific serine/threonine protein kinase [Microsporum canis]|uniref:non-specific serine/threonine protein kinase n=1 Tax=Arthroderma otae (strain ATCC MYA-4605 / CBS 113480) TaxID=554155 RepID=C5G0I5_ARTOC|nr:protein kinase domain-containing protein [Microsporum canis CBS 113480]EEQ35638.1 protein kinase domain-containing protein [Microsporum canis CBS 113480]